MDGQALGSGAREPFGGGDTSAGGSDGVAGNGELTGFSFRATWVDSEVREERAVSDQELAHLVLSSRLNELTRYRVPGRDVSDARCGYVRDMADGNAQVLYDRDCGFCRWTLAQVLRLDRDRRLRPLPIQSDEGQRLLAGVPVERRLESWHLVEPDGEVLSAEKGFPGLFARLPAGAPIARLTSLLQGPSGAGYRLIVANRTRLGRRIGQERRDRATRLLDERQRTISAA